MQQGFVIPASVLTAGMLWATATLANSPLSEKSLPQLEQRINRIDSELAQLAHYSPRSGVGSIGYRSKVYDQAEDSAWVEINFSHVIPIDEVVLVPAIWRDTQKGFLSDGFPEAFCIRAGTSMDQRGKIIAEIHSGDGILPRLAPLVIPTPNTIASWIRIEAIQLSLRHFDGKYALQLAELLIFSGQENVALRRPVNTSLNERDGALAWDPLFLTDGFVPYMMNAAQGEQSPAYLSPPNIEEHPSLSIDLGQTFPLSRIHLHAVDQGDTVPQSEPDGIGLPPHFIVEGANRPDFSDAATLLDVQIKTLYDIGPILMFNLKEIPSRYVRLTALSPYIYTKGAISGSRIGFAEIELFSGETNVALGKPVTTSFSAVDENRPISAITDGRNLYGNILPIRDWMNQLALRHDLETERPGIIAEINRRYARQKQTLRIMIGLAALLAAGIGFTILIDRMLRMHQIAKIRERFAADLHDELGANLHTIGLLSDLAEEAKESPEDLSMLHQRIRAVTERTGTAVRHCANLLEAGELYADLPADIQRATERILAKFDQQISFEGKENLSRLKTQTRADIFLFYKECLTNIFRHSGATQINTQMTATPKKITLAIYDNGCGIQGDIPASLKRRAKLLGAKVAGETPAEGGTCITLTLRPLKKWRLTFWK